VIIYLGLFLILIVLWASTKTSKSVRQGAYWFTFLVLFIFIAFRWEVGCDWSGYYHQYQIARGVLFEWWVMPEPAWWYFLSKLHQYGLNYEWSNVFSALCFFAGSHILAKRQPDALAFLILLFPILMVNIAMASLRQAIAIGFVSAAFVAFTDRRLLWFLALILTGSQFHSSAVVFLLLAPMVGGNYSRKRLALGVILGVPGMLALASGDAAETATTRYVGANIDAAGALFRVGFLGLSGFVFLWTVRKSWQKSFPHDFKLVMIGALMMVGALVLLPLSSVIADRLAYYLTPIQAVIFARIPYLPLKKDTRAALSSLSWIGVSAIFVVWLAMSSLFALCYTPYQTWLLG
jgi:hypothetical protein